MASFMWRLGMLCWGVLVFACILQAMSRAAAEESALPECKFPAVFAFGDRLTDTGNSIAAFPNQFAHAELDPHGVLFPGHAADRYTDGKLLIDFLAMKCASPPSELATQRKLYVISEDGAKHHRLEDKNLALP